MKLAELMFLSKCPETCIENASGSAADFQSRSPRPIFLIEIGQSRDDVPRAGEGILYWRFEMTFDTRGKALANERNYPFIVEVSVAANGLDVELNRQIIAFHKSHRIPPRFGRTIWRNEQRYYRWCFSDLETARAFAEQFGGAFYKTTGT